MAAAQSKTAPTYRLDFTVTERGERSTTARQYMMLVESGHKGKINTSLRVPTYLANSNKEVHTLAVGEILECSVAEVEAGISLDCGFEVSGIAPVQPTRSRDSWFPPVMRSSQVFTTVILPLDKATTLAFLDDPVTNKRVEVNVTARRFSE